MADAAKKAGLNIDYFPTNFVVKDNLIYYVDYECNQYMDEWNFENWGIKYCQYMDEWNFENWGIKYWSKTPEFIQYVKEHE